MKIKDISNFIEKITEQIEETTANYKLASPISLQIEIDGNLVMFDIKK